MDNAFSDPPGIYASSSNTQTETEFNNAADLHKWKYQLVMGDVVDACDKLNTWYQVSTHSIFYIFFLE
jgi:hypothetical protein